MLAELAESQGAAAVITAATFEGKEVAGRLAARLGSGLLADAVAVKADGSGGPLDLRWRVHRRRHRRWRRPGHLAAPRRDRGRRRQAGAGEIVDVEVPAEAENAREDHLEEPDPGR